MALQVDPAELRARYESWDTEELLSRVESGSLEPDADRIAREVLATRGVDAAQAGGEIDQAPKGPSGVGGWLLLLVIGLMFLGPVVGMLRLYSDLVSVEDQNPGLMTQRSWITFKSATLCTFAVGAGLGFYAGLGLARRRDMAVVKRAQILLWVSGPVMGAVIGLVIPFLVFGKFPLDPQIFGGIVASAIVTAAWTAYLSRSKRVRNTYGGPSKDRS